jgi:endonuclease G
MKRFAIIFLLLGLASLIQGQDDHSPYGMPEVGYLRITDGYTALYHPVYQVPLWVAYKVEDYAISAPTVSTSGKFKKDTFDPPLPDWAMLVNDHYTNSGFDRGHMFPNATAQQGGADMVLESYRMTNICPQTDSLNQGLWRLLEDQVRIWASELEGVWVITGPVLAKYDEEGPLGRETDTDGVYYNEERLPYFYSPKKGDYIVIPVAFYKIIVDETDGDPNIIAFIMPQDISNVTSLDDAKLLFPEYMVTVDSIEQVTGIDFLPELENENLETELPSDQDLADVWGLE